MTCGYNGTQNREVSDLNPGLGGHFSATLFSLSMMRLGSISLCMDEKQRFLASDTHTWQRTHYNIERLNWGGGGYTNSIGARNKLVFWKGR